MTLQAATDAFIQSDSDARLILLPKHQGLLDNLLDKAKKDIRISRQALPDIKYCDELLRVRDRGIDVRILLTDERYFRLKTTQEICEKYKLRRDFVEYSQDSFYSQEEFVYYLNQRGFYPHFINHDKFFLNHSKFILLDSHCFYLGSAYNGAKIRIDAGILSKNLQQIETLKQLFDADYENKKFTEELNSGLAIAPINMRDSIENLLNNSQESIYLMFPVLTNDPKIIDILTNKIINGVKIYILFSPNIFPDGDTRTMDHFYCQILIKHGAKARVNYAPIIHSKCLMVDVNNQKCQRAFLGSMNLRTVSIDNAREVGVYTSEAGIINELYAFFQELWETSVDYT